MCDRVAIIKEGSILKVESIEKLRENKYRKLRLDHRPEVKPDISGLSGVSSFKSGEGCTEFMYGGDINLLLGKLAGIRLDNVSIEEPSLEEIFMHYYGKEE